MMGIDEAIAAGSTLIDDAINKIWPSPEAKATAEAITMKAATDAFVDKLQATQSVMLAEAKSNDPWTSRARIAFLYVFYLLVLFSLPMGILFAFKPEVAGSVINGFHNWLAAIPQEFITAFEYGYSGYLLHSGFISHSNNKVTIAQTTQTKED